MIPLLSPDWFGQQHRSDMTRASANTADRLSKMGQEIGQRVEQNILKQEAIERAPEMAGQYKQAFNLIQQGDLTGGMAEMAGISAMYSTNPFLLQIGKQANAMGSGLANTYLESQLINQRMMGQMAVNQQNAGLRQSESQADSQAEQNKAMQERADKLRGTINVMRVAGQDTSALEQELQKMQQAPQQQPQAPAARYNGPDNEINFNQGVPAFQDPPPSGNSQGMQFNENQVPLGDNGTIVEPPLPQNPMQPGQENMPIATDNAEQRIEQQAMQAGAPLANRERDMAFPEGAPGEISTQFARVFERLPSAAKQKIEDGTVTEAQVMERITENQKILGSFAQYDKKQIAEAIQRSEGIGLNPSIMRGKAYGENPIPKDTSGPVFASAPEYVAEQSNAPLTKVSNNERSDKTGIVGIGVAGGDLGFDVVRTRPYNFSLKLDAKGDASVDTGNFDAPSQAQQEAIKQMQNAAGVLVADAGFMNAIKLSQNGYSGLTITSMDDPRSIGGGKINKITYLGADGQMKPLTVGGGEGTAGAQYYNAPDEVVKAFREFNGGLAAGKEFGFVVRPNQTGMQYKDKRLSEEEKKFEKMVSERADAILDEEKDLRLPASQLSSIVSSTYRARPNASPEEVEEAVSRANEAYTMELAKSDPKVASEILSEQAAQIRDEMASEEFQARAKKYGYVVAGGEELGKGIAYSMATIAQITAGGIEAVSEWLAQHEIDTIALLAGEDAGASAQRAADFSEKSNPMSIYLDKVQELAGKLKEKSSQ